MKIYFDLTKVGIALFSVVAALAGYSLSLPLNKPFDLWQAIVLSLAVYLVSSGSFAINQAQELKIDKLMPRTQKRPLPQNLILLWQAYALGLILCFFGLFLLLVLNSLTMFLALLTIVLYNGVYTLLLKPRWAFAAVPGAIPGAMPVLIGYSVNSTQLFNTESVYLFLIMFLWQMPHFWSLSIRFKEDYIKGGVPVLPVVIGNTRTLYHIGLYLIVYIAVAVISPLFVKAHLFYLFLVLPLSAKLLLEFYKYFHKKKQNAWLPFFLWTNLSVLIFMLTPALDKWLFYFI